MERTSHHFMSIGATEKSTLTQVTLITVIDATGMFSYLLLTFRALGYHQC